MESNQEIVEKYIDKEVKVVVKDGREFYGKFFVSLLK